MSFGISAATWAAIGAVAAVAGTGYAVYSAEEAKDDAEKAAKKQAARERDAAQSEADKIRERALRLKATQTASLAASGVKLTGDGTGAAILNETDRLAEQDALAVLKGGKARSDFALDQGRIDGSAYRRQGVAAAINGVSTLTGMAASRARATESGRTADAMGKTGGTDSSYLPKKRYSLLGDT